jgi:hypothetical protein
VLRAEGVRNHRCLVDQMGSRLCAIDLLQTDDVGVDRRGGRPKGGLVDAAVSQALAVQQVEGGDAHRPDASPPADA